ncbi:unnamed protein product [Mytilus edulis]|uniref:LEM domain-containing protein n=1 Tax=Mytilus edulis TaxID=6550 RepID=A0A8S3RH93_MYTED|nr:unnamed protein product [Mytilus edulis]
MYTQLLPLPTPYTELRQELNTRGIRIPPNTRRMALVRLFRESRENISSDAGRNNEGHANTILGSARSQNSTATDTTTDHVHDTTNNRTLINIVSRLSTTVQSLQHNSAFDNLDYSTKQPDNVVSFKADHPPSYPVDDCDNDTTIPYVEDQPFFQSSPIHSTKNHFLSSWTGQPTLPSSITPLRPSIVHRPSIPSTFAKRPAPITNRLQTPQHFSSLYPKLPISATASTTTPIASTVTATTSTIGSLTTVPVTTAVGTGAVSGTGAETGVVSEESSRIRIRSNSIFPR